MAGSKRGGTSWKSGYTVYKNKGQCEKNKARKLAQHQAAHPNDKQAAAVKAVGYTRSEPKVKGGWVTGRVFAQMSGYLRIEQGGESPFNVTRSVAVQKRIAQHMRFDRGVANERVYTQKQSSANKQKKQQAR